MMQLSNNGRVVVIDNEFEKEAKPLLNALNKYNIPYFYSDGSIETLPDKPYEGIRFVFLDVQLRGMEGKDVKTRASSIVGVLEKIISKDNGPYVIIFWTQHPETITQTLENCSIKGIKPIFHVDLEKASCKDGAIFKLDIIMAKLKEKAKDLGPYSLYVMWENIINNSGAQLVNRFAGIFPIDEHWCENTKYLFYRMYKAYVEKNEMDTDLAKISCVLTLINQSFIDTIENNIAKVKKDVAIFEFLKPPTDETGKAAFETNINTAVTIDIIARLNNSLFVVNDPDVSLLSGVVFEDTNDSLKSILIKRCIEDIAAGDEANVRLCKLVITPQCDICQDKAMKQRVIYGVLFEHDKGKSKKSDDVFPIGLFQLGDKNYSVAFNFQTIEGVDRASLKTEKMIFGLRRDLLFDIQAKAANHVNRLGNFVISDTFDKKMLK